MRKHILLGKYHGKGVHKRDLLFNHNPILVPSMSRHHRNKYEISHLTKSMSHMGLGTAAIKKEGGKIKHLKPLKFKF